MGISINEEVKKKAEEIIEARKVEREEASDKREYLAICLEACICPICGGDVTMRYEKKRVYRMKKIKRFIHMCAEHGDINYKEII